MNANTISVYLATHEECILAAEPGVFDDRLRKAVADDKRCVFADDAHGADLILVNQAWASRNWHDIEVLQACPFLRMHCEKILVINHDDVSSVFLPGLYTSLTRANCIANWSVPCGYKQQYRSSVEEAVAEADNEGGHRWLFSFRGAEFSHAVRRKLTKLLAICEGEQYSYVILNRKFHTHSEQEHAVYVKEMLDSRFVLAPRGFSPSTYRLYEAMQYGRCPVIISDEWQPVAGVDWKNCSIRIPERAIVDLCTILQQRARDSAALGRNAKNAWQANFADGAREAKILNALLELHANCSRARDFDSLNAYWRSGEFFHAHGWTLPQRLWRKFHQLVARLRA